MSEELKNRIRTLLENWTGRPARLQDIMAELRLPSTERRTVRRLMRELQMDGELSKLRASGGRYLSSTPKGLISGTLKMSKRGFAFLIPDAEQPHAAISDIYISKKRIGDAMNGDKVRVRLLPAGVLGEGPSRLPEGQVIEVVERGTKTLVGHFYSTRRGGNVIPRDERFTRTISTPRPDPALNIQDGDFVVAEVTAWTHPTEPLIGRVTELLGGPETAGIDITVLIRDAGVDPQFRQDTLAEVERIGETIPDEEIARRTDFRNLTTFTMDGATAKDFDDALSIERLENGSVRLGVHIADVSYYVSEGSAVDAEAFERATSIYPIDRVVPMLPEKLSNNLCSLRPHEDRLTMSCLMDIDERGRVHHYSLHEGIIRSAHRLIYEEVQSVMDGSAEPGLARSLGSIRVQLEDLYRLRSILTKMRLQRGALDLDIPETEVLFDSEGRVSGLQRRPRMESHRVVEECMLIANEVVASHLFNLQVPSAYRVHEEPDAERLRQLMPVLAQLGVKFSAKKDITPEAIQSALDQAAKLEHGFIARRLILRGMARARYADENLGHYGLASSSYTHFTSPIRRYPDLLVHRLIRETAVFGAPMEGRYRPPQFGAESLVPDPEGPRRNLLPGERFDYLKARMGSWTRHCSERERRAEDIENDAAKVKSLEYMRRFLGQEFDGIVTSVTPFGFFVELNDIPVEGLVHLRNLHSDFYEYDEEKLLLTGRNTGVIFKLADRVRVTVENVSVTGLELDFRLEQKYAASGESEGSVSPKGPPRPARSSRKNGSRPRYGGFKSRGKRGGRR